MYDRILGEFSYGLGEELYINYNKIPFMLINCNKISYLCQSQKTFIWIRIPENSCIIFASMAENSFCEVEKLSNLNSSLQTSLLLIYEKKSGLFKG